MVFVASSAQRGVSFAGLGQYTRLISHVFRRCEQFAAEFPHVNGHFAALFLRQQRTRHLKPHFPGSSGGHNYGAFAPGQGHLEALRGLCHINSICSFNFGLVPWICIIRLSLALYTELGAFAQLKRFFW